MFDEHCLAFRESLVLYREKTNPHIGLRHGHLNDVLCAPDKTHSWFCEWSYWISVAWLLVIRLLEGLEKVLSVDVYDLRFIVQNVLFPIKSILWFALYCRFSDYLENLFYFHQVCILHDLSLHASQIPNTWLQLRQIPLRSNLYLTHSRWAHMQITTACIYNK